MGADMPGRVSLMTTRAQITKTGLLGPNHALLVGEVLGALAAAGLRPEPVTVDGDFTKHIDVLRPSGTWRITVEPINVQEA